MNVDHPGHIGESTRKIASAGSTKSDAWITGSESSHVEDYYNPWSPEFVNMQLGQLQYHDEGSSDHFEMGGTFSVGDQMFCKERLIGEGNFAKVYLCRNMFDSNQMYAVKVQKQAQPWEWVILNEAIGRLKARLTNLDLKSNFIYRWFISLWNPFGKKFACSALN